MQNLAIYIKKTSFLKTDRIKSSGTREPSIPHNILASAPAQVAHYRPYKIGVAHRDALITAPHAKPNLTLPVYMVNFRCKHILVHLRGCLAKASTFPIRKEWHLSFIALFISIGSYKLSYKLFLSFFHLF
jgi:hypothetical protein